jgi:ornithine cyclodeaminase/alanine dehydrogenase-like protein (mu-crystallin family)
MRISFCRCPGDSRITRLTEILIVDEQAVEELLDPAGCLAAVEHSLVAIARGEVHLPLRAIVRPPGDETLIGLMPTHRGGDEPMYGLKTVVVVPGNSARGLDPHQGTVTLFDGETGKTVAVVNASPITAIRTAAASALATRELAREDARVLAIVGAGFQAKAHLRALTEVREFDDIRIASRTSAKAEALAAEHPAARATASIEEAIRDADVIVTVTSSSDPVVERDWVADGAHINAVGACFPHTRELDSATVAASTLVVDSRESAVNESGDYLIALEEGAIGEGHIAAELGEVLVGTHPGRTSADEITIFDSLGLAVEDLFAAEYVVARAREAGRGQAVAFA